MRSRGERDLGGSTGMFVLLIKEKKAGFQQIKAGIGKIITAVDPEKPRVYANEETLPIIIVLYCQG